MIFVSLVMGRILGFLSLVALALITASAFGVVGLGPLADAASRQASAGDFALDYRSLLLGTLLGVGLAHAGRFDWASMPRRAIQWLFANERNLVRCGWAAMFLGVLLFY